VDLAWRGGRGCVRLLASLLGGRRRKEGGRGKKGEAELRLGRGKGSIQLLARSALRPSPQTKEAWSSYRKGERKGSWSVGGRRKKEVVELNSLAELSDLPLQTTKVQPPSSSLAELISLIFLSLRTSRDGRSTRTSFPWMREAI